MLSFKEHVYCWVGTEYPLFSRFFTRQVVAGAGHSEGAGAPISLRIHRAQWHRLEEDWLAPFPSSGGAGLLSSVTECKRPTESEQGFLHAEPPSPMMLSVTLSFSGPNGRCVSIQSVGNENICYRRLNAIWGTTGKYISSRDPALEFCK